MKNMIATLTLLAAACVPAGDNDATPQPDAGPVDADLVATAVGPPEQQIGDYCLLPTCDAVNWAAEGGGDDQCDAITGFSGLGCCMPDGLCHRGVRFHGPCFALSPVPEDETCPHDANDNGVCVAGDLYYKACP